MKKFKEILFLTNLKRVGKKTIYKTYWNMLNDAEEFYDLVSEVELTNKFSTDEIKKAMAEADELYDYILTSDINVITVFDEDYPEKLNIMEKNRPLVLYIKGNVEVLKEPNLAVIGTRKPSDLSKIFESDLIKSIVNNSNRVIISGLALGCDKIAHQTTVDENKVTIAILPSGVDVITPASNKKLAKQIINNGGCLVSEYKPNAKANKGSYVERDGIVAAFSDATFVVECGIGSGTMHTVEAARDYGRQLFAYLPNEKPVDSYDGNEFILKSYENAIKVQSVEGFLNDLESLKDNADSKKEKKIIQQTLI